MNEDYHIFLYQRVKEIQPHLTMLVQNYKAMGMTDDEINTEICFAIIHEGYRIRHLEQIKNEKIEIEEEKNESND